MRCTVFVEERQRVVEGLGLDVLGEAEEGRPAACRVEHGGDRLRQRRDDLLGPRDAVPVANDGLVAVVDGEGRVAELLDLLEHGVRRAVGEGVAGEEKDRQPVGHGDGRSRHHVGGARADRGQRHHDLAALHRLGEADRGKRHRLLVLSAPRGELVFHRLQRLAEAGHVAVAEDREDAGKKRHFLAIDDGPLGSQVTDQGLRHGQADSLHRWLLPRAVGRPVGVRPGYGRVVAATIIQAVG